MAFNPPGDWSCFYRAATVQLGFKSEILHNLISDYLGGRQYDRNSLAQNSTFGVFFQKNISLPGKTPNHLKLRIRKRENEVLKCDVIFFCGLSISAKFQRSQNPQNHKLITCQHLETIRKRAEQISENLQTLSCFSRLFDENKNRYRSFSLVWIRNIRHQALDKTVRRV